MEAAAAMDFHALSRRELQALCKRNGVRANMTNAAMAEALQGLTSVDGIDEIGTTLCLPTPGRSAMKSAAMAAEVAGEEQQHGSPLPRGRRVLVKSPEAIRMEVEEGDDQVKRDLVKEIVRTPGVALHSTSRRARATPAPIPTPVPASSARATARRTTARKAEEVALTPATLRRSQRTAGRKAAAPAPVDAEQPAEDVSSAKRTTRRSARSKVMMDLDHEEEVAAAASKEEEKVQQEEPKAVASDVKCDNPEEEEEVTKLLEGDHEEEEPEEGEEADSSDTATGSAVVSDKSCDDTKVEEEATKPQEGTVEEKEPTSAEKSAPLATMEDSPILGVLTKADTAVPVIEKAQDASLEDGEGCAEWSPAREMTDEIIPAIEDKEMAVDEAVKEDGFTVTGDTEHSPKEILPAAAGKDATSEEDDLTEVKEGAADELPQAELADDETSEEDEADDLTELKEGAAAKMPQAELTDDETSEEDDEWTTDGDEASEDIDFTDESDEETDETNEESDTAKVVTDLNEQKEELVQMLQETVIAEEASEDDSTEEDDDFTGDLPPEFDDVRVLSDAGTESDIALPVLEENQAAVASAAKTAVKSLDDSTISEEHEVSSEEEVSREADATEEAMKEVDNIVKSLDEFAIKEGIQAEDQELNTESEAVEAKETQKQLQVEEDFGVMSLRKLRATYKKHLIAAKEGKEEVAEGKRLPLAERDDNACVDC